MTEERVPAQVTREEAKHYILLTLDRFRVMTLHLAENKSRLPSALNGNEGGDERVCSLCRTDRCAEVENYAAAYSALHLSGDYHRCYGYDCQRDYDRKFYEFSGTWNSGTDVQLGNPLKDGEDNIVQGSPYGDSAGYPHYLQYLLI